MAHERCHAEFFDREGHLAHNMTGTLEEVLLTAQGRTFSLEKADA